MTLEAGTVAAPVVRDPESALVEAILRTIRYADLFDQAINVHDIVRYLDVRADDSQVVHTLARHIGRFWLSRDDLYCLPDRSSLLARTQERARSAGTAWVSARRWATVMAHLPFVRMIAVTGSLAMNNMGPGSDIDYLVVTVPKRVWTTRLLLVAVVRLARLGGQELCPNYVLSTHVMQIEDQSLFTARELKQMVPVFGEDCYGEMMALNRWAQEYLPASSAPPRSDSVVWLSSFGRAAKAFLEAVLGSKAFDRFEHWEMSRKIARLSQLPGAVAPNVVLSAEQCKGHFRGAHRSVADRFNDSGK
jgi:predicted nucleotidyltransferase